MNKVYKISNKISKTTLALVIILGITSCSTYQPSGYESDGVYYNPKTDKTYQEVKPQYGNEQASQDNSGDIKIGTPYFDSEGNGAEQFYYQDSNENTSAPTSTDSSSKVTINNYGLGGMSYFGNNNYSLSYNGNDTYNWGRNDGVEINIWNNNPWFGGYYGWGGYYNPYRWGYYNPWYGGYYGGYHGGYGFGFSMGWSWGNPWYNGYYGWGYRPYYGGYYGNGYYGGYYGNGYYGNNWYRPRGIYTTPGNRYDGRVNNSFNSTRPVSGIGGRNNGLSNNVRPNGSIGSRG